MFPLFGLVGLVWALVWFAWFRDDPHAHPSVSPAELAIIGSEPEPPHTPVRWRGLLANRSLRALCAMYLGTIYGWYFFLSWLPQYLLRARGFDLRQVGWLSALPLVGIASGVLAGGWLSDVLTRRVGVRWGRRLPGLVGLPVAAVRHRRARWPRRTRGPRSGRWRWQRRRPRWQLLRPGRCAWTSGRATPAS